MHHLTTRAFLLAAVLAAGAAAAGDLPAPAAVHELHHGARHGAPVAGSSPYGGLQQRQIKALSDQQVADLRAGKGMSYALPAELNGYPGPAHALELADQLGLNETQKSQTETLLGHMKAEAKVLGEALIAREAELDQLFKTGRADDASVEQAVQSAALAQGKLRASHLQYHLKMMQVLTPAQVASYAELRGYR